MRITIINQFYVPDIAPTAHLSASLAEHLAESGHEVTVVTSRGGYTQDAKDASGAGTAGGRVSVKRVWTPKLGKGSLLKRLTDYAFFYLSTFLTMTFLRRQDVIISLTTPPFIAWSGVVHGWLHRRSKLILWNMDCYPEAPERAEMIPTDGFISRVLQFFNRALFRRIDHLIGLDTAMVDLLMGRYAPKKKQLATTIIPNFEDASFFPLESADGAEHGTWEGVERLGLADKFVVLYLGNMGVGHDFDTALDAAEKLKDDDRVRFLYIGGGARKDPVAQEAEKRGLTNVIVHSYVPKTETPAVMSAVACSLITLRDDMLGVMSPSKLHSNLAMRLPILYVGPETSNVDDAIKSYQCGRTVPIGDADALAAAIRELANDPAMHESMRSAARRAFDEAYNDRAVMPKFDEVIASVTA